MKDVFLDRQVYKFHLNPIKTVAEVDSTKFLQKCYHGNALPDKQTKVLIIYTSIKHHRVIMCINFHLNHMKTVEVVCPMGIL